MVNAVDIPRCGGTATTGRIGLMLMKKVGVENSGPQNNAYYAVKAMKLAGLLNYFIDNKRISCYNYICCSGVFLHPSKFTPQ
jgi:hypothetical protein